MKPLVRRRPHASARGPGACAAILLAATPAAAAQPQPSSAPILTVCADPNNLPFSDRTGAGFENRIATLLAKDMGVQLRYFWWAQRRGFVRNTLGAAQCDLWPGIAAGVENVAPSHPYYRSTYVFVTRADRKLQGLTLDDPRLRSLSIGVQMIGNDGINTPPAHAIARRGLTQHVHGYMLYGNYVDSNPPSSIIDAVARGEIDVALAWGPLAGFFASRAATPLRVEPVTPVVDAGVLPMTYDISMGIRRGNPQLQQRVNALLEKDKAKIDAILREYHVPLAPALPTTAAR